MSRKFYYHTHLYLHNVSSTTSLGKKLASILTPGLIIYLHGDVGSGKTLLTRALLHAAGHTGIVKSPTYNLIETYLIKLTKKIVQVIHFDLYRINKSQEFFEAGLQEYINPNNICIIEWPENCKNILPMPDINISFLIQKQGRNASLQALSEKGHQCLTSGTFLSYL